MALEIREANFEDAPVLAELNGDVQAVHANALPEMFKKPSVDADLIAWFEKRTGEDDQLFFIAYLDDVPAGYAFAPSFKEKAWEVLCLIMLKTAHHTLA